MLLIHQISAMYPKVQKGHETIMQLPLPCFQFTRYQPCIKVRPWDHHARFQRTTPKRCDGLSPQHPSFSHREAVQRLPLLRCAEKEVTRQCRAATRGSIPSVLCAQKQRSQSHHTACRAMCDLSSSQFHSTRKGNENVRSLQCNKNDPPSPLQNGLIKKKDTLLLLLFFVYYLLFFSCYFFLFLSSPPG